MPITTVLSLPPDPSDFLSAMRSMHVSGFATYERLINFYLAGELQECLGAHSIANSVKHEPCRFLSNLDIPRDFIGRNAVLAISGEPHGAKPLVKTDSRILKNRKLLDQRSA
jgi:hypothetical protein